MLWSTAIFTSSKIINNNDYNEFIDVMREYFIIKKESLIKQFIKWKNILPKSNLDKFIKSVDINRYNTSAYMGPHTDTSEEENDKKIVEKRLVI